MKRSALILFLLTFALLSGCANNSSSVSIDQPDSQQAQQESNTPVAVPEGMSESERANALFEELFMQQIMRSPMFQSYLGIKTDSDKWDDYSEAFRAESHEILIVNLQKINTIDADKLDQQTSVSLKLFKDSLQNSIDDYKWRYHSYPLNQMSGIHSGAPALLINQHTISDISDANAYISRLKGMQKLFSQTVDAINIRQQKGIMPPKFVYGLVISASQNVITGAPFDDGDDSTLLADFRAKVDALEIDAEQKTELLTAAKDALITNVKPGYENIIAAMQAIEKKADDRAGAWKFPDGDAFFENALARTTTTNLTAENIHQTGLSEVARIHNEMRAIMETVNFEGDLSDFFKFMRNDEQFYYADTVEGKQRYLTEATALIDNMKLRLDELFILKPKAGLKVKAVEPFREASAGKAFYQTPSMDGSRPGIYYANLYNMRNMPIYQMEALAYHEGLPGHHMQLAIAQELDGLPKFRKFARYTAYTEGWGLYSELVPKEIGLYQDPYSDFGRLAMELWRACRLVVDTGIHVKKWTREQGIAYYVENTPNSENDAVNMVERHIVYPSQATAYKVGMLKILELRENAKQQLGDTFDIREFHDIVLKNGPLPLTVLEEFVDQYIQSNSIN